MKEPQDSGPTSLRTHAQSAGQTNRHSDRKKLPTIGGGKSHQSASTRGATLQ